MYVPITPTTFYSCLLKEYLIQLDYHKSHSISVNSKKKQVESLSNTELASQILKCDMGRLMNECNIKELLMKNSLLSQSEQEFLLKKIN
jgi:hypothetical protein